MSEQRISLNDRFDLARETVLLNGKNLPPRMREAFSLRVLDDVPSGKVCKSLGVSTTNLWTLVHRAKLRLRRCLSKRWFLRDEMPASEDDVR